LDFSVAGATEFSAITPLIGQIFYIGDGQNASGFQQFIAPAGATRLFLGIPDGFGFDGHPGAYDDNDGSYRVNIGVNQIPTRDVPEGGALLPLFAAALGAMAFGQRKLARKN
jgi:hypothetical protein